MMESVMGLGAPMSLMTLVVSILFISSLWFFNRQILPDRVIHPRKKGDIQRASTYAYGSVRQYPSPTYWQMVEELLYINYWRMVAFWQDGCRLPNHVLYGENLIHSFCEPLSLLNQSPTNQSSDSGYQQASSSSPFTSESTRQGTRDSLDG